MKEETQLQKTQPADSDSLALMDTQQFEHMQRIATVMGSQSLIPDHLVARPWWYPKQGSMAPGEVARVRKEMGEEAFAASVKEADRKTIANCFRVVNQALRWGFDPFSIIDSTYSLGDGKLAFEGKLVAAVVNTRGGLVKRLAYSYSGRGDDLTVTVTGTLSGESEPRQVTCRLGDVKTYDRNGKPKEMWIKDPEQKLAYNGAAKWARRHCPEVMLGVFTEDDLDRMAPRVIEGTAEVLSPVEAEILGKKRPLILPEPDPPAAEETEDEAPADNEPLAGVKRAAALAMAKLEVLAQEVEALESEAAEAGVGWDDILAVVGPPDSWEIHGITALDVRREITKRSKNKARR